MGSRATHRRHSCGLLIDPLRAESVSARALVLIDASGRENLPSPAIVGLDTARLYAQIDYDPDADEWFVPDDSGDKS